MTITSQDKSNDPLHAVRRHWDGLAIDRTRPLIVSDADEVLLEFVRPLERFLEAQGMYLDLAGFRLTGNIRHIDSREPVAREAVPGLIAQFFAEAVDTCRAVPGAAEALEALSARAQVVILSNVPQAQREIREQSMARDRLAFPVISNRGPKGPAVKAIADGHEAPVIFLDDLPHNIASVAEHAGHVHRIHFVADPRLAALIDAAPHSHHRVDDWPAATEHIDRYLASHGY